MTLENSEELGRFVQTGVWLLGALWLIIQIIKSLRRSPPPEQEFLNKTDAGKCQASCAAYRTKNDADNRHRDDES